MPSDTFRREPTEGTILCVPLPNGRFAYLCAINGVRVWLYRFVTDYPVREPKYFATSQWLKPYLVTMFPMAAVDACKISLSEENKKAVPLWYCQNLDRFEAGLEPPRYMIHDPALLGKRPGTPEEVRHMYQCIALQKDDLIPQILGSVDELELIHVPVEDRHPELIVPERGRVKYRRAPTEGVVVRVRLPEGEWAYLCASSGASGWLYRFVTDHPLRNPAYFKPSEWFRPFIGLRFLPEVIDVCKITLTPENKQPVPEWKYENDYSFQAGFAAPRYLIFRDVHRPATAEEIKGLHREVWLTAEQVVPWIMEQRPEMELIHVPPEDRDTRIDPPPTDAPADWAEDEVRLIEIIFPPGHSELAARREEMEGEFEAELQMTESGLLNGGGEMLMEGGSFDIALDVDPRRLKTALRAIRKVLKRFKAPPDTQILEHHPEYEDPIEHPLIAPARPKGK